MRTPELVDRRVLGAIRFVSWASDLPIDGHLLVATAPGSPRTPPPAPAPLASEIVVRPNRSGLHVIHAAPGFEEYTATFDALDLARVTPAPRDLRLRAIDPADRFLPLDFDFPVPRPQSGSEAATVPVRVRLYPTPTSAVADGWAVVRVRVERELVAPAGATPPRVPVPGALVRVLHNTTSEVLGRGVTEWRYEGRNPRASLGQGLVTVADIPLLRWSEEADAGVLDPNQQVRFDVTFDSAFDPTPAPLPPPPGRAPVPDLTALESIERPVPAADPIKSLAPAGGLALRARDRRELTFVVDSDLASVRLL